MKKNKYTIEFKEQVLKEYLEGASSSSIERKYEIDRRRVYSWRDQLKSKGKISDGRGKSSTGRPKVTTLNIEEMTKDEYIAYLEMELKIAKYIASLERKSHK